MMRQFLFVCTLLSYCMMANADDLVGKFGLGIGDDSEVKLIYFVSDSVNVKIGTYISKLETSNDASGDVQVVILGIRKFISPFEKYSWFIDSEFSRAITSYSGATTSEDNDINTYGLFSGIEYRFNESISVSGRLGVEYFDREYETSSQDGYRLPVTKISINYLFGT